MSLFVLVYASSNNVYHVHIKCNFFISKPMFCKECLESYFSCCSFRNVNGWRRQDMNSVEEANGFNLMMFIAILY